MDALPDGRGARRRDARRRPARVAGPRLRPPRPRPLACRAASSVTITAAACPTPSSRLEALPGVGPYTARAVAAIAFGQPVGRGRRQRPARARTRHRRHVPTSRSPTSRPRPTQAPRRSIPATWTHAVMDLGATVCRPREPRCDACPRGPSAGTPVERRPKVARQHRNQATRDALPSPRRAGFAAASSTASARRPTDDWVALDGPIGTHRLEQRPRGGRSAGQRRDGRARAAPRSA